MTTGSSVYHQTEADSHVVYSKRGCESRGILSTARETRTVYKERGMRTSRAVSDVPANRGIPGDFIKETFHNPQRLLGQRLRRCPNIKLVLVGPINTLKPDFTIKILISSKPQITVAMLAL